MTMTYDGNTDLDEQNLIKQKLWRNMIEIWDKNAAMVLMNISSSIILVCNFDQKKFTNSGYYLKAMQINKYHADK